MAIGLKKVGVLKKKCWENFIPSLKMHLGPVFHAEKGRNFSGQLLTIQGPQKLEILLQSQKQTEQFPLL